MRVVLIHRGPSDTCPCDLCHADVALHPEAHIVFREDSMMTEATSHDCDGTCDRQGRSCEQVEANEWLATWLFVAAAVLAVVIALCAAGRAVGL